MIKTLEWDSRFFGFPVGIINLNDEPDWDNFIPAFQKYASGYKLIYFITDVKLLLPEMILKKFNGQFINQRILYYKNIIEELYIIPDSINEYEGHIITQDFIDLAYLSGSFSRFKIDRNFQPGKFEELYKTWIKRSLNKSIADKVYVSNIGEKITAMVSCKYNSNICNIGLMAVLDSEQGKGTGRYLIQKTENQAFIDGLKEIRVPTQSNNINACRFYEKLGFSPIEITNYYHLWVQ